MAGRSRRHHYVPKALQRYFAENGRNLWYTEKASLGKFSVPEYRNISSTFQRHDYYTILDGGLPSDRIEKQYYALLDDQIANFLSVAHAALNRGLAPIFDQDSLASTQYMVLALASRTPHGPSGQDYDDLALGEEYVNRVILTLKEQNPLHPRLPIFEAMRQDERALRYEGRSIRVLGQIRSKPQTESALSSFDVRWAVANERSSFVLHAAMVYRLGNGRGNGLENPDCEWWVPISPKRVLILLRDPQKRIPLINAISDRKIREINEYGLSLGVGLASYSQKLLASLIGL